MKYVPEWDKCVDASTVVPPPHTGPKCIHGEKNSIGKCDCKVGMKYVS